MRTYDFSRGYKQLLKPDIVALLTSIHEYKGEQALFIEAKADVLTKLWISPRCRARRLPTK